MTIGDTVYVWWYGKPVQGMIVENKEITPMLASMVVVRIPIQGVHASALFMPHNVFETEEQILFKHKVKRSVEANKQFEVKSPDNDNKGAPIEVAKDAYKRLIEFKNTHWNNEHNHIETSALNDFYDLWVNYMTQRLKATQTYKPVHQMAMEVPETTEHPYAVFKSWEGPAKPEPVSKTVSRAIASAKRALKKASKVSKNPTVVQLELFT